MLDCARVASRRAAPISCPQRFKQASVTPVGAFTPRERNLVRLHLIDRRGSVSRLLGEAS
jgi:hypothetical protein